MLSRIGMVEFLNVMSSVNIKDVVAIIILADLIRVAGLFHRVGERGVTWGLALGGEDGHSFPVRVQNNCLGTFLRNDKPRSNV